MAPRWTPAAPLHAEAVFAGSLSISDIGVKGFRLSSSIVAITRKRVQLWSRGS